MDILYSFWEWIRSLTVQEWTNILLATFNAVYVFITYLLLRERRRERQPDVYAELQSGGRLSINLLVSNRGEAPARNVSVKVIEDEIDWHDEDNSLEEASIVREGRGYIRPGGQISYPVGVLNFNADNTEEKKEINHGDVKLLIGYENESGRSFNRSIEYKFSDQEKAQLQSIQSPSDKIVDSINSLSKNITRKLNRIGGNDITRGLTRKLTLSKCPYCFEEISSEANKCPECHEWLPDEEKPKNQENDAE